MAEGTYAFMVSINEKFFNENENDVWIISSTGQSCGDATKDRSLNVAIGYEGEEAEGKKRYMNYIQHWTKLE